MLVGKSDSNIEFLVVLLATEYNNTVSLAREAHPDSSRYLVMITYHFPWLPGIIL